MPDRRLVVPGKKRVFYRVIPGDSIWAIARFFKVNQADLLRWNNLDPEATLATKMVLDLWVDKDFDTGQVVLVDPSRVRVVTTGSDEFFELVETLRGRKRVQYKCQSGDNLDKVAKRFGLTVADVERINRMGRTTEVIPGQTIIVYQTMSGSERTAALARLLPGYTEPTAPADKPMGPPAPEPAGEATPTDAARAAAKAAVATESAPEEAGPRDGQSAPKPTLPESLADDANEAAAKSPAVRTTDGVKPEPAVRPLPPPPRLPPPPLDE